VSRIEREISATHGPLPPPSYGNVVLQRRGHAALGEVWHTMFHSHRQRAVLGLVLMSCQVFFYNAIFFTYALVLTKFTPSRRNISAGSYCPSRLAISPAHCCSVGYSTPSGGSL
jgi:hypothetical protein